VLRDLISGIGIQTRGRMLKRYLLERYPYGWGSYTFPIELGKTAGQSWSGSGNSISARDIDSRY
jgi:hypothetical protein